MFSCFSRWFPCGQHDVLELDPIGGKMPPSQPAAGQAPAPMMEAPSKQSPQQPRKQNRVHDDDDDFDSPPKTNIKTMEAAASRPITTSSATFSTASTAPAISAPSSVPVSQAAAPAATAGSPPPPAQPTEEEIERKKQEEAMRLFEQFGLASSGPAAPTLAATPLPAPVPMVRPIVPPAVPAPPPEAENWEDDEIEPPK
ncbi:hypothetical protein PAPYR_2982 [Paratrimastix pyriformis]|uniref:Uncharacterized protein n=1 Tax=Paratrimastix pyriformis TaxID=342808 RepID=A0ABQ8UQM6_9EUKA|nr:hypothetical protein PAPYR_2982 [Paratrimastix pyriformis]